LSVKLPIFKLLYDDNEFKLLKIVVEVLFKLLIDNVDDVDIEFKLLKIVVDVLFKLFIDNVDDVDKLFKFVFVAKVEPFTVNDDKIVALFAIKLYELRSYNPELFIL
jgi:hypothetical protein